jgi:hypothetical protein
MCYVDWTQSNQTLQSLVSKPMLHDYDFDTLLVSFFPALIMPNTLFVSAIACEQCLLYFYDDLLFSVWRRWAFYN